MNSLYSELDGNADFFPPVALQSWNSVHEIFRQTMNLEQHQALAVFAEISHLAPGLVRTTFQENEDYVIANQLNSQIAFPNPIPRIKLAHLVCGYVQLIWRKYTLPNFVQVEIDDIVIDCGSFVGGFTMGASQMSQIVHSFEPEPKNFTCLSLNTRDRKNCVVHSQGLADKSETRKLNLSANAVEHSYLQPDADSLDQSIDTLVTRLDDFCEEQSLPRIDFLKLEAEGFEVEVLAGLGSIKPRKIAIDVSPERNGESPAPQIISLLSPHYQLRQRRNVLFARIS